MHESGNLSFVVAGFSERVEAENFLQRFLALLDDGKIVEGKMRDEAPEHSLARGRADRGGGLAQGYDAFDGGDTFEFEIAAFISHGEAVRQIAVRAGAMDGGGIRVRMERAAA